MEQNLRFPAQCVQIPPEEQQQLCGGAPAWMTDFVADVKETLRPYQPYFDLAWRVLMVGMSCISVAVDTYDYVKIMVTSLKEIRNALKQFP